MPRPHSSVQNLWGWNAAFSVWGKRFVRWFRGAVQAGKQPSAPSSGHPVLVPAAEAPDVPGGPSAIDSVFPRMHSAFLQLKKNFFLVKVCYLDLVW